MNRWKKRGSVWAENMTLLITCLFDIRENRKQVLDTRFQSFDSYPKKKVFIRSGKH